VFSINIVCAQKSFNVTINLDSSIVPQNVRYNYRDGKTSILLPDTFGNKRVIVIKSKYYSPLASFHITYTDPKNTYSDNDFFITDKPATISFYSKANNTNKLEYNFIKNAIPIYDTNANKSWRRLHAFLIDTRMTKENSAFDFFLAQNKGFKKNDSLTRIFNNFYKTRLNNIMSFLKKYPDDYFSFWYFINQVAQPIGALKHDKDYLKEQLAYLNAVFPAKYTGSVEGKELVKTFELAIDPLKLNDDAPPFTITTIDGKKISLDGLKEKYTLLDFWATWCPPCMAEIPFIREIRKSYSVEKLAIVGISQDYDFKKLNEIVKREGMNWPHFYDENKMMRQLYGIGAFPTLILINKDGKIIYKSDHIKNDQEELPKMLEGLK
jgi:thiol-disulfide isomerase/thioredoxin